MLSPPSRTPAASGTGVRNHVFLTGRTIAVHNNVIRLAGNVAAGVFLSQLIYWTRHGVDVSSRQGWVRKTADQWQLETGMSWKVQKRARQHLVGLGLMEERRVGLPAQSEYRVNVNELASRSAQLIHMHLDQSVSLDLFRSDAHVIKMLLGKATAYQRRLAEMLPHINDALFLSRLIQESGHNERWVCLSRTEWLNELMMTRPEWETARRHLREAGLLYERGSNYPRRVDFMVPASALLQALSRLQAKKTGAQQEMQPSRLDRANLTAGNSEVVEFQAVGGNGRILESGKPTSVSPDPAYPDHAFKADPIQPTTIAQSSLYLKDQGLQKGLQPPLHRPIQPSSTVVGVVAEGEGPTRLLSMESVLWPSWVEGAERVIIWTYLVNLSPEVAQTILDEMDWLQKRKGVNTAPGLARMLAMLAKEGRFVPEGAHKILAARKAAAQQATVSMPPVLARLEQAEAQGTPVPSVVAERFALLRKHLVASNTLGGFK